MKYIPSDKLIAKIVELRKELPNTIEHLNDEESGFARGQQYELTAIEAEILCILQEQPEVQNGKFVFPKYLYARTKDNKTIDMSYAPQDMTAVEYIRNDFVEQEQPEVDLVAELKHHLATTPKEQLEKEWKELEPWNNIGPTVQEFLYGKQPEVDFEKEMEEYFGKNWKDGTSIEVQDDMIKFARHFWNKGYNAKKEK